MSNHRRSSRLRVVPAAALLLLPVIIASAASGPSCFGDVDFDGEVGISDLLLVLQDWGQGSGTTDFSGVNHSPDGVVDLYDFLGVLEAWGVCEP